MVCFILFTVMPKRHSLALVKNWPHAARSARSKKLKRIYSFVQCTDNHKFQSLVSSKNDQISLILACDNVTQNDLLSISIVYV